MGATSKTDRYKKLAGTYQRSRARVRSENPVKELAEARELQSAMALNLKLAGEAIREYGMRMMVFRLDTHRRPIQVEKSNPALRIQRESAREFAAVSRLIPLLEEDVAELKKKKARDNESKRFQRPTEED